MTSLVTPDRARSLLLRAPVPGPAARAYGVSPPLAGGAIGFFAAAVVMAGLMLVDGRTLNGVSVWMKPAKFYLSVAIQSATMAWALTLLAPAGRQSRGVRVAAWLFVGWAVLELAYITLQAGRGLPSHFNVTTTLYRTLYSLMGIGALTMIACTGYLGARILRRPDPDARPVLARAAGVGLLATAVLGGAMGIYLGAQRGHWVGGPATDAGGLPLTGWSTAGGDLRVAHFFGLHAMQVIAAAGWLAGRLAARRGTLVVSAVTFGWAVLTVAVFVQAVSGRPFLAS
jgi:hypothetical protein